MGEVRVPERWNVYLAGEIHSDWRDELQRLIEAADLPVRFTAPVTDHAASDDCGVRITGPAPDRFWHDRKGALLNAVRTRTAIKEAHVVVVRFGDRYKQWNAAFDAGLASAWDKPLVILHDAEHDHALKEIDAAAAMVCRTPSEVAAALAYVISGRLP
ncbi:MAG: YtoQ family protein [Geminicoccaceae bacterium]|nr:MAG: YtoQ family protein [Geminicoccaceae bacterium]